MNKNDRILQEALLKYNVLTEEEFKGLLPDFETTQEALKDYLLKRQIVTGQQIQISLSQTCNLEMVQLAQIEVDKELIESIPIRFVTYYHFLPLHKKGYKLTIAVDLPMDLKAQDELRTHLNAEIKTVLAESNTLNEAIKKHYGFASDTIDRIMAKDPGMSSPVKDESGQWIEDLERKTDDPTVSHLVNQIILEAYNKRATDIHIEPYRDKVRFRYRIDGVLVDAHLPENVKHFIRPILSRIKILANLSITERRLPQDGSAVVKTKEQNLDLRVSTMPTPRGESMVIRILPSNTMLFSLEKLGFNGENVQQFRELIQQPHGIIFITGPTGSGKTTTLYACLNEINSSERKIITIEDPVEYEMQGITQIQVNPRVGFGFAEGLRSLLRHDPDIIMVGEARDLETAEIAIRTALTGHLVFSTLHTNDASSGITRLIDMGIEPYLVSSSVEAFVAQRLVRVICPKCKEVSPPPPPAIMEEIKESLGILNEKDIKMYHGAGCEHCNQTGYYGRSAIYEILRMNEVIRAAVIEKPRSDYIKEIAVKEGLVTLRQSAWQALLEGITTLEEVLNVSSKDEVVEIKDEKITPVAAETVENVFEKKTVIAPSGTNAPTTSKEEWLLKNKYEARSYPRISFAVDMRYKVLKRDPHDANFLLPDGIEYPTMTHDISAAGLSYISKNLIPIGTILEIQVQLGEGKKSIECLAKVCRVEEDNLEGVYNVVVYYLDISSAEKVVINKFVEKKLSENRAISL